MQLDNGEIGCRQESRGDTRAQPNEAPSTSGRQPPPGFGQPIPVHQQQQQKRRPLLEYKLEADLAKACEEAAAQSQGRDGGKPRLHLVVLGHVDAGKSTLMGRLMHDLG